MLSLVFYLQELGTRLGQNEEEPTGVLDGSGIQNDSVNPAVPVIAQETDQDYFHDLGQRRRMRRMVMQEEGQVIAQETDQDYFHDLGQRRW